MIQKKIMKKIYIIIKIDIQLKSKLWYTKLKEIMKYKWKPHTIQMKIINYK